MHYNNNLITPNFINYLKTSAYNLGVHQNDIDDIVQQAIFNAWQKYNPNISKSNYSPRTLLKYAAVQLRFLYKNQKRTIQHNGRLLIKSIPISTHTPLESSDLDLVQLVNDAITQLPEPYQSTVRNYLTGNPKYYKLRKAKQLLKPIILKLLNYG